MRCNEVNSVRSRSRELAARFRLVIRTIRDRVPPGLRSVLGLVLITGGVFGFLPVLGFWMIPLGVAVVALDVKPILRWWQGPSTPGAVAGLGEEPAVEGDELLDQPDRKDRSGSDQIGGS